MLFPCVPRLKRRSGFASFHRFTVSQLPNDAVSVPAKDRTM